MTTHHAHVPGEICMGGATPVYGAGMGVGMKKSEGEKEVSETTNYSLRALEFK
jgi:hypothetical protein